VFLVVALVLASVVTVAGAFGIFVYDKATAIDRSTPDVAVDQFLHAAAAERDRNQTSLFVCSRWAPEDALRAATEGIDKSVKVSWGAISVSSHDGAHAQASASVRLTVGAFSDIETWRFEVVSDGGWRVCSLVREAVIQPTTPQLATPQ
jgi:hypothetical protein